MKEHGGFSELGTGGGGATWGEPGPDRGGYYRQSSGVGSWSQRKGDPTEGFKMEAHMISFGP